MAASRLWTCASSSIVRAVPPLSMGRFTGVGSPAPSRLGESRSHWLRAAILVGAVYLAVGLTFSALASAAESHRMVVLWRLAAWVDRKSTRLNSSHVKIS